MTITRVSFLLAAFLVLLPAGLARRRQSDRNHRRPGARRRGRAAPGRAGALTSATGERTVTSGDDGSYRFGLLGPGDYVVSASLEGLGATEISAPLDSGARRTIDLTLRASTAEAITVTADALMVDPYVIGSSAARRSGGRRGAHVPQPPLPVSGRGPARRRARRDIARPG